MQLQTPVVSVLLDKHPNNMSIGFAYAQDVMSVIDSFLRTASSISRVNGRIPDRIGIRILDLGYPVDDVASAGEANKLWAPFIAKMVCMMDYLGYFINGMHKYPEVLLNSSPNDIMFNMYKKISDNNEAASFNNVSNCSTLADIQRLFPEYQQTASQLTRFLTSYEYDNGKRYLGFHVGD